MDKNSYEFDVALSFAGEDRDYVNEVASILRDCEVNVFYDKFEEVNLWGKNLYVYLREIYKERAKFTVMFISKHYAKKLWCHHERESAQDRAFGSTNEYILPVRFDDAKIPGLLNSIGYLSLEEISPHELSILICKKLNIYHASSAGIINTDEKNEDCIEDTSFLKTRIRSKKNSKPSAPSQHEKTRHFKKSENMVPFGFKEILCKHCNGKGCWSCNNRGLILAKSSNECIACKNFSSATEGRICTYCLGTGYYNFIYIE